MMAEFGGLPSLSDSEQDEENSPPFTSWIPTEEIGPGADR